MQKIHAQEPSESERKEVFLIFFFEKTAMVNKHEDQSFEKLVVLLFPGAVCCCIFIVSVMMNYLKC